MRMKCDFSMPFQKVHLFILVGCFGVPGPDMYNLGPQNLTVLSKCCGQNISRLMLIKQSAGNKNTQ